MKIDDLVEAKKSLNKIALPIAIEVKNLISNLDIKYV